MNTEDDLISLDLLTRQLAGTRAAYKAEFLRVMGAVSACLAGGLTIRAIYDDLTRKKQISCTYETFRTYVRKHIEPHPHHDQLRTPRKKRHKKQADSRSGKRR